MIVICPYIHDIARGGGGGGYILQPEGQEDKTQHNSNKLNIFSVPCKPIIFANQPTIPYTQEHYQSFLPIPTLNKGN